jgi:hypothetical protein
MCFAQCSVVLLTGVVLYNELFIMQSPQRSGSLERNNVKVSPCLSSIFRVVLPTTYGLVLSFIARWCLDGTADTINKLDCPEHCPIPIIRKLIIELVIPVHYRSLPR